MLTDAPRSKNDAARSSFFAPGAMTALASATRRDPTSKDADLVARTRRVLSA